MPSPVACEISELPTPKRQKLELGGKETSSSSDSDSDEEDLRLFEEEFDKSEGFDIDFSKLRCTYSRRPVFFDANYFVAEPDTDGALLKRLSKLAIEKRNEEEGTNLEFVKVVKANYHPGRGITFYITFEAKDPSDCQPKPYQALVSYLPMQIEIIYCRPKPCQKGMGVIKDGSISGVLPSSNEVFAVHYPGYPSSTERAVETLGGNQGILKKSGKYILSSVRDSKLRTEKSNKLKLHFRPEDPYSHPAFGELQPCNNYLLKISKKKVKKTQNSEFVNRVFEHTSADSLHHEQNILISKSTEIIEHIIQPGCESISASSEVKQINDGAQEQLSADIVARVSEAYHFHGMVDYQHVLAVHADVTRRKKRNWAEVEPQLEKGGLLDVSQEDLMILVPPLFSTKDLPEKVVLKSYGDPSLKRKQEEVVQPRCEMEIEQCLAIDFNIKEIPKKVNWENSIPRNSDRWRWQMAVCELFDERPIWVKHSLAEHLLDRGMNVANKVLRRLLFIAAYYFSNGPYLRFWIRKGYDPRKDPESRIYQRTDFRVPPPLRSYCDTTELSGLKCRWEDICAFRVFPRKCQLSLQLFELKDDYIQQEIRKPASQGNCSLQTGWFSAHVINTLRWRVAQRFLSVYPEAGAESLLKNVSSHFEKSKRLHLKVDGDGKKANKEVLETEDKETNDEAEYEEDEEDEMEDDHLEEDMDADEELDPVDHLGNFSLQDSYIDQENVSKDYLQELFGSFPFGGGGGGEMQHADPYEEGYQIYEQYSDNYSDDEDY